MSELLHALVAPTASGKESTALAVASLAPVEILSLDSMKVYRGMDVGTAKAPAEARARIPHHLVDIADPRGAFSTGEWLDAALAAVDDVRSRGRVPLLSGGTALYLKACIHGLFSGPAADPGIRRRLKERSGTELHARLQEVDPATAEKVHPNDIRRLVRALEVFTITGRPI
ncbi:MAG: tRNA (adenosine(37)-N6)-dimethylallyltransferase MiaA, partial [Planctomycetota bacterium]